MKTSFISVITAFGLLAATSASATDCSIETVAGRWFGGDTFAVCRMNFRENGRIGGFCEDEYEDWDGDQMVTFVDRVSLGGRYTVDSECMMDLRLRATEEDGDVSRVRFKGRLTGAASSRPDIAVLSTGPGSQPRLNITLHRD